MSKQSVEQILKDVIEASNAKTVALTEQLQKLAGERDSYADRMHKMEENLTSAMKKVLEMDANIKDFHKAFGSKVDEMEAKFASWWKDESDTDGEMDKPDNWDDMSDEQKQEWMDSCAKKGEAKAKKLVANVIEGVNPKVVKGQPNPANKGKPTMPIHPEGDEADEAAEAKKAKKASKHSEEAEAEADEADEAEEAKHAKKGKKASKADEACNYADEAEEADDADESEEHTDMKAGKKGKKAAASKKAGELEIQIEHESEEEHENEGEEGEEEEGTPAKKLVIKGKKGLVENVVKPDTHEVTALPEDETAKRQVENIEDKLDKKGNKPKGPKLPIEKHPEIEPHKEMDEDAEKTEQNVLNKVGKKAAVNDDKPMKDGDEVGNAQPVNHKFDKSEVGKDIEGDEAEGKAKKGKKADEAEAPSPAAADLSKIVESVSGKIEAAYEKLAAATMKQAQAETKATAADAELAAAKAKAEQEASEKHAALEAAKTLAMEVKAREEAVNAVKALEAKLAEMMDKVAKMEAADKTVEMKAAKVLASTGLTEPVESAPVADKEQTEEAIMAKFESLQGKEQRAFYLANKAVIERVAFRGSKNRFR